MDTGHPRWTLLPRPSGWGALALATLFLAGCNQSGPPPIATTPLAAVDTPPPAYPPELACNDIGGKVELRLIIGIDGKPTDVQILRSSDVPALDAAARDAVQNWRFEPATAGGSPVSHGINVPVTFTPPSVKPDYCLALQEHPPTSK